MIRNNLEEQQNAKNGILQNEGNEKKVLAGASLRKPVDPSSIVSDLRACLGDQSFIQGLFKLKMNTAAIPISTSPE